MKNRSRHVYCRGSNGAGPHHQATVRRYVDLLLLKQGRRVGVEIKRVDAPRRTRSMIVALNDLRLDALYVAYPGDRRYAIDERIEAVPVARLVRCRPRGQRQPDVLKGRVVVPDSFFDPLPDEELSAWGQ